MSKCTIMVLSDLIDCRKGWEDVSADHWVELLLDEDNRLVDIEYKCDCVNGWGKFYQLDGLSWVRLLRDKPHLANKCDLANGWKAINNYYGFNFWAELLEKCPTFANKCDEYSGWEKLNGKDWVMLLREQPAFAIKCDLYDGWNKIGVHWAELLEIQPMFSDRCDKYNGWELFDGYSWFLLLSIRPCFVNKCDLYNGWMKILEFNSSNSYNDIYNYEGYYDRFDSIGLKVPWLVNGNNFEDIDIRIKNIFKRRHFGLDNNKSGIPVYILKRRDFGLDNNVLGMPVYSWLSRENCVLEIKDLEAKRYLVKLWKKSFGGSSDDYEEYMLRRYWDGGGIYYNEYNIPFFSYFANFNDSTDKELSWILSGHLGESYGRVELTELETGKIVKLLSKNFWVCLLRQNPRIALTLAEKYDVQHIWRSFTLGDWKFSIPCRENFVEETIDFVKHTIFCDALLAVWPDFFNEFDSHRVWPYLLKHRPDWVNQMIEEEWDYFDKEDFKWLLTGKDSCVDGFYQDWSCYKFWYNCLLKAPEFLNLCEDNKGWEKFSNYQLCDLMIKQSAVVKYCKKYIKWGQMDSSDWIMLLKGKIEGLNVLDICDEYNAWQSFKCSDWYELLEAQPQLSIYCDKYGGWSLFDDGYWMLLLNKHSQFIEKYRDVTKSRETDEEILNKVNSYIAECDRRIRMDRYREYDYSYLPADWAEESGWNDMYGGGCDPSDFIDYD